MDSALSDSDEFFPGRILDFCPVYDARRAKVRVIGIDPEDGLIEIEFLEPFNNSYIKKEVGQTLSVSSGHFLLLPGKKH